MIRILFFRIGDISPHFFRDNTFVPREGETIIFNEERFIVEEVRVDYGVVSFSESEPKVYVTLRQTK